MPDIYIHDFYPHPIKMRYGCLTEKHRGIASVLDRNSQQYRHMLVECARHIDLFDKIEFEKQNEIDPFWNNGFFPFLDVVALFGLISTYRPKLYIEIGSGNSTKVANYTRKTLNLDVRIVSIDPTPRAEIDAICDKVIREPLQDCDLAMFDKLEPGDILFFDGSHRVLQNSDNQVLFFEIIPRLKTGVLIHLHDINWPNDYPDDWNNRFYNEQYILGAMLLYAPEMFNVIFPGAYVTSSVAYEDLFGSIWRKPGFEKIERHGCSFWFEKLGQNYALKAT